MRRTENEKKERNERFEVLTGTAQNETESGHWLLNPGLANGVTESSKHHLSREQRNTE